MPAVACEQHRDEWLGERLSAARLAGRAWSAQPMAERLAGLKSLRLALLSRQHDVVATLTRGTERPKLDALTSEVFVCLDALRWLEEHASSLLAPQHRRGHELSPASRYEVWREPFGAVAIFSPWNYPLQLALVPMVEALAAGNAVLLKPSERCPEVADLLGALIAQAGLPNDLVQIIQGGPELGEALVRSRPDLIHFTGGLESGRSVLRAAADGVVPVKLELGGKDAMVVFADANLERAARGAVYGAFANAGQVCVSVERVYVERAVYERFIERVTELTAELRVGRDGDLGDVLSAVEQERVARHVRQALALGAKPTRPFDAAAPHARPLVLRDATQAMALMQEETFGPVMPVMPFDSEAQAITLANDSVYGLSASVWTSDAARARRVVAALEVGSCAVNDVLKLAGHPDLPFGGVKASGFGRSHGEEGLLGYTRTKAVQLHEGVADRELNWFPLRGGAYGVVGAMNQLWFRDGGTLWRALRHNLSRLLRGRRAAPNWTDDGTQTGHTQETP